MEHQTRRIWCTGVVVNIIEFAQSPELLRLTLSPAQRTLLKAFYGLTLTDEEAGIFLQCVERPYEPREYSELSCIAGARSGKDSRIATSIALYEAFNRDHLYLHPGEKAVVLIVAQDARAGGICFNYLKAAIEGSDLLSSHVIETRKTEIELDFNVTISVFPCTYRSARGTSILCAIADELSFWRDENSANPDREILRSMARGMAGIERAKLVKISTPYAKSGALYDDFVKRHELPDVLVWRASTALMNPSISTAFLNRERLRDPVAFEREYNAIFSDDIGGFIGRAIVEAAVVRERLEVPHDRRFSYRGFVDTAGGSGADSMALGIAHTHMREGGADNRYVLDALREVVPPFSPASIVGEFAALLKSYGLREVYGDAYGAMWVQEQFRACGIEYKNSAWTRSQLYLEFLPLLNSGKLELLDHAKLIGQICGLERRSGQAGNDRIDHAAGAHDDLSNVAAGALVTVALQKVDRFGGVF
jgi:hypothetical protein